VAINSNDYYVVTSRQTDQPDRWSWEIRRKRQPLGIKLMRGGYHSEPAAKFAGKQELADFLLDLMTEDKRPLK
jgi:hypothetical protein